MPYPLDLKMKDFGFNNWTEAAANAPNLLNQGHIDLNEYENLLGLAKKEQAAGAAQQQRQVPAVSNQPQPNPTADSMNGRTIPQQSLPTWDQVMKFMREISGPRPAY